MSAPRYVLLGLAAPRAAWFTDVSRWATAGSLPIEFVRCLSHEELRTRLSSGRGHSAALLDGTHPSVDRDLLAACTEAGCAAIVLADDPADWVALGATGTLSRSLVAPELLGALAQHARTVYPADEVVLEPDPVHTPWRGSLIAVTGTGGCGTSTLALGLGSAMARQGRGRVLLADLARRADQGLLHGTGAVVPGLPELVEHFRNATPDPRTLRASTFEIGAGDYDLLIGMRRPAEWTTLRPRAVAAALAGLRSGWDLVVADVDPDVEGQSSTGSVDIEERNGCSRAAVASADVVIVATRPGLTGIAALVRTVQSIIELGTDPARVVPVINRAPRRTAQVEVTRSWAELIDRADVRPPVVLPNVSRTEASVRDARVVPPKVIRPLRRAVDSVLLHVEEGAADVDVHELIRPGSLGALFDADQDGDAA